ncbi:MAG: flagellin [Campylobacterota bacterium]|nr:flagellin [Campylobacterota bacterium]
MLLGRPEMIEKAQVDYISKISKVQEAEKEDKVDPDEKYRNLQNKEIKSNEIILDNVKFGYNEETDDFFIRIKRGNNEYQFPTEYMFKLKENLKES